MQASCTGPAAHASYSQLLTENRRQPGLLRGEELVRVILPPVIQRRETVVSNPRLNIMRAPDEPAALTISYYPLESVGVELQLREAVISHPRLPVRGAPDEAALAVGRALLRHLPRVSKQISSVGLFWCVQACILACAGLYSGVCRLVFWCVQGTCSTCAWSSPQRRRPAL